MKPSTVCLLTVLLILMGTTTCLAEIETYAFQFPADSQSESGEVMVDLRYLNESEAGETGFIRRSSDGNGFVRGDGEPIRFWGVTPRREFVEMPMDSLKKMARFYAKMGMNMIRIHAQLSPKAKGSKITDVDMKEVDGIWKTVAAFKNEGIYTTISPYWPSGYYLQHVSAEWGLTGYEGETHLWNVLYFNGLLQKGYKSWVKTLYTEPNPYTGLPLKDDPAVAIIQIQNEDGMLWWTVDQLHPAQKRILENQFSEFVKNKYGSIAKALNSWENVEVEKDRPAEGFLKLYPMWELTQDQSGGKALRVKDQTEFLARLQYDFNNNITTYYKEELGCRQLVNANNWFTVNMSRLNDLERWTYSCSDIMAVNRYFTPGHVGENSGWRIDPGHHYVGRSVLFNPASFINNIKQPEGFPCLISEGGWNLPSPHLAEAPFLTAAYQSLTGLDGLLWYTTTSTGYDRNPYITFAELDEGQFPLRRWTIAIPQMLGLFPANALMYRLGYVSQAKAVLTESFPKSSRFDRQKAYINEVTGFDPNRPNMLKLLGQDMNSSANPLVFGVGPVKVSFENGRAENTSPKHETKSPSYISRTDRDSTVHTEETANDTSLKPAITGAKKISNNNDSSAPGKSAEKALPKAKLHPEAEKHIDMEKKTVESITGELCWDYGRGIVTLSAEKVQAVCGFDIGHVTLPDVDFHCGNPYSSIQLIPLDDNPIAISSKLLLQVGTRARPTDWQEHAEEFGDEGRKQKGFKVLNTGRMPWLLESVDLKVTIKNSMVSEAIALDAAFCKKLDIQVSKCSEHLTFILPEETMYVLVR